ncbi:MAG: hypothetical protein KDB68_09745 [Planctomycetes bacterium]|nr:hypothetical protein [Planctomycetota bacterium]
MLSYDVDLKHDAFHVKYSPDIVSVDAMLAAIDAVGFKGAVFEPTEAVEQSAVVQLDLGSLPQPLKDAFDRATAESRLVLIDIHGPG